MTLPRTAAEVLSGHVMLEVRCTGRAMLTFRQPRLQYGQGIHGFFCQHRLQGPSPFLRRSSPHTEHARDASGAGRALEHSPHQPVATRISPGRPQRGQTDRACIARRLRRHARQWV